jgi:NAD(P)-dependent dehydrogenase (short-subunit alcohol dehydrogenase family)
MPGQFSGKVALVTGGSSGMGRAAALAFAREGASVVVADTDAPGGEETVHRIQESGGEALFVPTDVSQSSAVESLVAATVATYGRLDCAFNNAGINIERGPLTEGTEAVWDRIISINLKGVMLCMKYEIPSMLMSGSGGAIVNTASVVGLTGGRGFPAYVASKHGVIGLTKATALDYAKQGIRVNAVCPGTIYTPMYERRVGTDQETAARIASEIPLGRLGQPHDVAEAVLWLCSPAASFVTGHALVVDGGDIV